MADHGRGSASGIGSAAASVFAATIVALAIGFVTSIVVARLLGTDGRGLLGVAFSTATIAVALLSLGIPIATTYYASRRPRRIPVLVGNALLYGCVVLVVLLGGAWLVRAAGLTWHESDATNLWTFVAFLTSAMYLEFVATNVLRGRARYARLNLLQIVSRATALVLTVALVAWFDFGVEGAIVALIAGSLVYAVFGLAGDVRRGIGVSLPVFAATVHYGWRVQAGRLLQIGNGRLDVLILATLAPLTTVGVYVVSQVVAELVVLPATAIGFVTMPAVARGRPGGTEPSKAVRTSGTLSVLGAVGVALVGPLLIRFGYGSDFIGALGPLYILLPGVALLSSGSVIAEVLRGRGHPGAPSVLAGIAIVVTVVLDLALIPPFEAVGAAIASTCAYAVFGLGSIAVLARWEGLPRRSLLILSRRETKELLQTFARAPRQLRERARGNG